MASQSLQKKRPFDQETAIQEVRRGLELMNRLRSHLQLPTRADDRSELARDLTKRVQQALTAALSILKSNKTPAVVGPACSSTQENEGCDKKAKPSADGDKDQNNQRGQKRRRHLNSWTKVTPAPYDDGHQWRKYGQKKIHNSKHPRSYYRCTHKDDRGCLATKQVQQQNNCDGSLMFLVIYTNQHTCSTTMLPIPQLIVASTPRKSSFFIFESKELMPAVTNVINHEQLQLSSITPPKGETIREMFRSQSNNSYLVMNSTSSDQTKLGSMEMMDEVMTTDFEDILLSPREFPSSHESEFEEVDNVLSTFVQYGLC